MKPINQRVVGLTLATASLSMFAACGDDQKAASSATPAATAATTPSTTTAGTTPAVTDSKSATKYRAAVIAATNAWLKTLTSEQRDTATYDYDDTAAKQQWSNFPAFFKPRTGVAYKDMSAASNKAALAVAKALLSEQGYEQYQGIRAADNALGADEPGGNFGDGNFYVSIFGTPSATEPFMVSLNGHHSSFNLTFAARIAASPEFVGVEPSSFQVEGHTEEPMKNQSTAVFGLLPDLPAAAKLSESFDDIMVGPQKDGQFPTAHEGVKVSDLPAADQQKVTDLITAYVGDAPAAVADDIIAGYEKQYDETYVSYAGSTKDEPGTYIRLDGPGVWIELAVQTTDKNASHYHSVYRDKQHDYGA